MSEVLFCVAETIMACRGVFFALTPEQKDHLLALTSDQERLEYVQEVIEEAWDEEHLYETDKAWDAMHRCLTDGSLNGMDSANPLSRLILGGKQLYSDTQKYVINLVEWHELSQISAALKSVTRDWLQGRYKQLSQTDYPQEYISEDDWEYTWAYFSGLPEFIARAQRGGRCVIFTVDQ